MNTYTLENVALGKLSPGDKIPFDGYVKDLELQQLKPYAFRDRLEGNAISSDETVVNKEWDYFAKECYTHHINYIFATAPHKQDYDDDGLFLYKLGLNEFIMGIYPLYTEILRTEVEYDVFDLVPAFTDKVLESECYEKISKFLVAMKMRKLRQGGCVNRYVKNLPYIPYFVQRLLKVHKNRYLLANSDTNSLDYKLAILSAIQFMNPEHSKLFELKSKQWLQGE